MNIIIRPAYNLFVKCFSILKPEKDQKNEKIRSSTIITQEELEKHPLLRAQKLHTQTSAAPVLKESFGEFGTATAHRINTLAENRKIQTNTLNYYEDRLLDFAPAYRKSIEDQLYEDKSQISSLVRGLVNDDNYMTPEEKANLVTMGDSITHAHKMLQALDNHDDISWLPSPFVRDQFSNDEVEFIPSAPVNLRVQKFSGSEDSEVSPFTFARLGVFFDPRDAGNTISELEKYLETYPKDPTALNAEIAKRQNRIIKLGSKQKNASKVKAIRDSLKPLLMIRDGKVDEIKAHIAEKQKFIDDQMLQLVDTQLTSRSGLLGQLQNDAPFMMLHLGLLNEKKAKVHRSGLIMDEGRFITEMSDAFKRFEGKKIIFDGQGPFIDENGNIHAKQKHETEDNQFKELELKPLFTNLTVQGNTKNGPIQKELNKQALDTLKAELDRMHEEKQVSRVAASLAGTDTTRLDQEMEQINELARKLVSLQIKLDRNQSNYNMACDLFPLMIEFSRLRQGKSAAVVESLCCFSGKDRTGIVAGVTTHRSGVKPAVEKLESDPKQRGRILSQFAKRILYEPEGLGAQVLLENTGTTVYKVSSLFIPEVADTIAKLARRILEYPKALILEN